MVGLGRKLKYDAIRGSDVGGNGEVVGSMAIPSRRLNKIEQHIYAAGRGTETETPSSFRSNQANGST